MQEVGKENAKRIVPTPLLLNFRSRCAIAVTPTRPGLRGPADGRPAHAARPKRVAVGVLAPLMETRALELADLATRRQRRVSIATTAVLPTALSCTVLIR